MLEKILNIWYPIMGASTFHYPVYKVDYTLLIKTLEYAIICRAGARSANTCAFLSHEGFEKVHNVKRRNESVGR